MTNLDISIMFWRNDALLVKDGKTIAYSPKMNNLFTFKALHTPEEKFLTANYSAEPSDINLWHHRLAHINYSTLENMRRLRTVKGLNMSVDTNTADLCVDCPFGKQTRQLFKQSDKFPDDIGDIIASDVCGPFDLSVGRHKYFITWIDVKTCFVSIEFLRDKRCDTVTRSIKQYMTWLSRQKGSDIRRVRTDNGGEYVQRRVHSPMSRVRHHTRDELTIHPRAQRHRRVIQ